MEKCKHCEEKTNFFTLDKDGEVTCESCESSDMSYPNTVIVVENGNIEKFLSYSIMGWKNHYYETVDHPNGVVDFKHKSTSAWRGYHYPELEDGYISVASGWSTGRWSDVPWKHKFNDMTDDILKGDIICPVELIFSFGLTSNVFSTSTDVIIKESDFDTFAEWVKTEAGVSLEELNSALS